MAKFYQHMQPGADLGKVTKLKYIDDISDDELTLYVFEDNTKCDQSYIAEINCMEAFNGRYMMTELSGPTNKWSFETKEYNLNETTTAVAADGNTYEIPAAGIGRNGEHVSLTVTDEGTPIQKSMANSGKRTDAIPPHIVNNRNIEPIENYLLSLHPELLTGVKTNNTTTDNVSILSHTVSEQNKQTISSQNNIENINLNMPAYTKENITMSKVEAKPINVIETIKHESITIDLDSILNSDQYGDIVCIINGKQETISKDDFVNRIKNYEELSNKIKTEYSPFDDPDFKEDILVTNMIDKSKKKVYTIGIDVEMELPPKEVYNTIKNVYPDGMSQNFVTSIARRMNNKSLKEALAQGLTNYYEDSIKNNSDNNQE